MAKKIALVHHYKFPSKMVWNVATDFDCLRRVTEPLITFKNLPTGKLHEGLKIEVEVSIFGKLPYQPYTMQLVECDEDNCIFYSDEKGAGVTYWRHRLQVLEQEGGCRIEEQIEIEAGLLTPLFCAWARYMYNRRHAPRLQILKDLQLLQEMKDGEASE